MQYLGPHFHHEGGHAAAPAINAIPDLRWAPVGKRLSVSPAQPGEHAGNDEPGAQGWDRGLRWQPAPWCSARSWEQHHGFATSTFFPRGPRLVECRAGKTLGLSQRAPSSDLIMRSGGAHSSLNLVPIPERHVKSLVPGTVAAVGYRQAPAAAMPLPRIHHGGNASPTYLSGWQNPWGFSEHHPRRGKSFSCSGRCQRAAGTHTDTGGHACAGPHSSCGMELDVVG